MEHLEQILASILSFGNNIWRAFELRHLIDISILSIAIYKLLWMLRTTSSGRVLRGIVIMLIGLWVSSSLRLYAISFLLSNALEWGFVVFVVLFQPEIRRFLERMGSTTLGKNVFGHNVEKNTDISTAISKTVEAYENLSQGKVGALMIFERNDLIDREILDTGTQLDCRVDVELLKNIFWNKAPLHDCAVIVRDGRIIAAGCLLPSSRNPNLSQELGARHKAGIGISECSDAVAVIVSEETGSISIAVAGGLKRHLTCETLTQLLKKELLKDDKTDKKVSSISGLLHKEEKEESS